MSVSLSVAAGSIHNPRAQRNWRAAYASPARFRRSGLLQEPLELTP